jgi:uncharacterized ferritin-like protein (DUF455 family)
MLCSISRTAMPSLLMAMNAVDDQIEKRGIDARPPVRQAG